MKLTPVVEKFVLHWGEMGTRWGVNRSVAQIHAILIVTPRPLSAEEISGSLAMARSTVSTGLKELQSWGAIRVVHVLGDRRDHFQALDDVWEMFRILFEERKRREIDPTLAILDELLSELEIPPEEDEHTRKRLVQMQAFFQAIDDLYEQIRQIPTPTLRRIAQMRGEVRRLLGLVSGE